MAKIQIFAQHRDESDALRQTTTTNISSLLPSYATLKILRNDIDLLKCCSHFDGIRIDRWVLVDQCILMRGISLHGETRQMNYLFGHVKGELNSGRRMINSFEWYIGVGIGGVLVSILFRMILHSKPRGLTRFGFNS